MVSTSNSPTSPSPDAAPALTRPGTVNAPSASAAEPTPTPSPSLSPAERASLDDFAALHRDLFHEAAGLLRALVASDLEPPQV